MTHHSFATQLKHLLFLLAVVGCSSKSGPAEARASIARAIAWHSGDDSTATLDSLHRLFNDTTTSTRTEAYARATLAGQPVVIARYRTGSGVSWQQSEYRVVSAGRIVWTALANESMANDSFAPVRAYHIESCIATVGDSLLAYYLTPADSTTRAKFSSDTVPKPGLYGWNEKRSALSFVGPTDSSVERTCKQIGKG